MNESRPGRRIWPNILLFALTVVSTFAVGLLWGLEYVRPAGPSDGTASITSGLADARVIALAVLYAAVLMIILLGHELGHYLTCRRYGIVATLPFFIPAPTLVGTLGAIIRIRSPITRRRQLFDIGAAGPLTGFILSVPAIFIGLAFSKVVPGLAQAEGITLGEPLLFRLAGLLFFRSAPPDAGVVLHPVAFAGWVGLLVTAFNLFPIGQLDGGHIAYALAGRRAKALGRILVAAFVVMSVLFWAGWLLWAGFVLLFGLRHPQVLDEGAPLGRARRVAAALVILVFVLSFIPDPVKGYGLIGLFKWLRPGVK